MKIICAFSKYQYGDPSRGIGIEYEAFVPALQRLGHDVRHFETWDSHLHPTYASLNRALVAEVDSYHPDIVFTVQRDCEIWTETLNAIQRRCNAALVTWTTDDSFKFDKVSKYLGHYYDAITTTYEYRVADYKAAGIEGVYATQWAANSHWLHSPQPACECRYPVSFIGASYGARAEAVKHLGRAGIHVECFGYGWPNGSIPTGDIPRIMGDSVVSLNFSAGFLSASGNDRQIKARTFEVPGAGGFLLTDMAPGLDALYVIGEEIEVYNNLTDLVDKAKYYLDHPDARDRIARAGHRKTVAAHTYERRLEDILRFAQRRRDARMLRVDYLPSLRSTARDVVDLAPPGAVFLWIRSLLVRVAGAVFGQKRACKAARKLVFELSIRIVGIRTFGARSVPGRMFPYA